MNLDLLLLQLDRLMSVYWHLLYPARVTERTALLACGAGKLAALLVLLTTAVLQAGLQECDQHPWQFLQRPPVVFCVAVPELLAITTVLVVSCYCWHIKRKLGSQVNPVALPGLPPQTSQASPKPHLQCLFPSTKTLETIKTTLTMNFLILCFLFGSVPVATWQILFLTSRTEENFGSYLTVLGVCLKIKAILSSIYLLITCKYINSI